MRVVIFLYLISGATCVLFGYHPHHPGVEEQSKGYIYNTSYYQAQVDHFGFENNDTYKMRYLTSNKYWDHNGGPILLYTGNEGDVSWFCNNTGFMWDIAPEFKAMLVFAEHRYYGESMPYGKDSFNPGNRNYLTVEQALADFAELIRYIKTTIPGARNSPVIAFGGSYGGMLAAWFRMKYPNVVSGSIAASAPIWSLPDLSPCSSLANVTTKTFQKASPVCAKNIKRSWDVILTLSKNDTGRNILTKSLRLCNPLKSYGYGILTWLSILYTYAAMVDYPYPANFLEPLPAWPVKAMCSHMSKENRTDEELLLDIASGLNVYLNYTGDTKCFHTYQVFKDDLVGAYGWGYQTCTEIVMPFCSGVNDMFPVVNWDGTAHTKGCQNGWKVTPRPEWTHLQFGAKNITAASNIIFSNGLLDPWSGGGVLESLSDALIAIVIPDGAHHLDLRSKNKHDPASVTKAREMEKMYMRQWIKEYHT